MPKKLRKIQFIILTIIILIITVFIYLKQEKKEQINQNQNQPIKNNIWLTMNPIKCLGNPWEFDWLKNNNNQYNKYPTGNATKIDTEEIIILKNFYAQQGINILNTKSTPLEKEVCNTCSCDQGYKLDILTLEKNAEKMIQIGWERQL